MLHPGGYIAITVDDDPTKPFSEKSGTVIREHDTFTCGHGNEIVRVPDGVDAEKRWRRCLCCMKRLCDACAAEMDRTLKCVPFERRLEILERRDLLRRRAAG